MSSSSPLKDTCKEQIRIIESYRGDTRMKPLIILQNLAQSSESNQISLCSPDLGLVNLLIRVISEEKGDVRLNAMMIIRYLARSDVNKIRILKYSDETPNLIMSLLMKIMLEDHGDTRIEALNITINLARAEPNKILFASPEFGLISKLIRIATVYGGETKLKSLAVMNSLANAEANHLALAAPELGLVTLLMRLIADETGGEYTVKSLEILISLTRTEANQLAFARRDVGLVDLLLKMILTRSGDIRIEALFVLTNLAFAKENKSYLATAELGIIPMLTKIIKEEEGPARVNALGILQNLGTDETNQVTLASTELGLIPFLIRLIKETKSDARIKALLLLQNIAYNEANQEVLLSPILGFITLLKNTIQEKGESALRALGVLQSIAYHDCNQTALALPQTGLLKLLIQLVIYDEGEMRVKALSVLQSLAFSQSNQTTMVTFELGLVPLLVRIVTEDKGAARVEALGVLKNLAIADSNKASFCSSDLGLLNLAVSIIREGTDQSALQYSLWLIWLLSKSGRCAQDILQTGVEKEILSLIKGAEGYPNLVFNGNTIEFNALNAILCLSEHLDCRSQLKQIGTVEVLGPMTAFDTFAGLEASLACTFLIGREESSEIVEVRSGVTVLVDRLIDCFQCVVEGASGKDFEKGVFELRTVVMAIAELALSDSNKKQLAIPSVRDLLVRIINDVKNPKIGTPHGEARKTAFASAVMRLMRESKKPSLAVNEEYRVQCAEAAVRALFQLSFINEDSELLCSEQGFIPASSNIRQVLEGYISYVKAASTSPAALLMSRLTFNLADHKTTPPQVSSSSLKHVMISYCWNENAKPALVAELARELRRLDYEVWRDVEGSSYVGPVQGQTEEVMAEAIEYSHTVIICVSKEYKDSFNCRLEANYVSQLVKRRKVNVIFVMMNECYTTVSSPHYVDGYLGLMVGGNLWYPLWSKDIVKQTASKIAELLGTNAKHIEGTTATTGISPPMSRQSLSRSNSNRDIINLKNNERFEKMEKHMLDLEETIKKLSQQNEERENHYDGVIKTILEKNVYLDEKVNLLVDAIQKLTK